MSLPHVDWLDDRHFVVDGVDFVCSDRDERPPSTSDRFTIVKPPWLVRHHLDLLAGLRPRRIVEVGIWDGGSTALFALVAEPEMLLAVERSEARSSALGDFVSAHGLADRVVVEHGVDQADAPALRGLVDEHVGEAATRPLDLVVDDASHRFDASRVTFEALFPYLAPGGVYVLEDWSTGLGRYHTWPDGQFLAALVIEMALATGRSHDVIDSVELRESFAVVTRGPVDVDAAGFSLRSLIGPKAVGLLPAEPGPEPR